MNLLLYFNRRNCCSVKVDLSGHGYYPSVSKSVANLFTLSDYRLTLFEKEN